MVYDGVESFPEAASGNFPFEFVSTGLNLAWENSFFGRVKCSSQLVFVEPAIIQLLLVIPPVRSNSTDQVHDPAAGWIGRIEIEQIAHAIFLSVEEVGGQHPGRPFSIKRSFHVRQKIVLLKLGLNLLKLPVGP